MSKSQKRVTKALADAGFDTEIIETADQTRTAAQAAVQANCEVDQIAKSIIFRTESTGVAVLFVTAGGNQVDTAKASALVGEALGKADAALIRKQTGFAIGGVSPVGHLSPIETFIDPRLLDFSIIWAAAGTPRHIFSLAPSVLRDLTQGQVADFTQ